MSSSGHVFDMINRIKQNAALKQNRRNKKTNSVSANYSKANFKKVPQEELDQITHKIRARAKAEKQKYYLKLIVTVGLFIGVVLSVLIYFF